MRRILFVGMLCVAGLAHGMTNYVIIKTKDGYTIAPDEYVRNTDLYKTLVGQKQAAKPLKEFKEVDISEKYPAVTVQNVNLLFKAMDLQSKQQDLEKKLLSENESASLALRQRPLDDFWHRINKGKKLELMIIGSLKLSTRQLAKKLNEMKSIEETPKVVNKILLCMKLPIKCAVFDKQDHCIVGSDGKVGSLDDKQFISKESVALAVGLNNNVLILTKDGELFLWDRKDQNNNKTLINFSQYKIGSIDKAVFSVNLNILFLKSLSLAKEPSKTMLCNIERKEVSTSLEFLRPGCNCIALSSDGRFVSAGFEDGTFKKWRIVSGLSFDDEKTVTLSEALLSADHKKDVKIAVTSLIFCLDDKYIAAGTSEGIFVFNATDLQPVLDKNFKFKFFKKQEDIYAITCITFDPSNKYIVAGTEKGEIIVWDYETREPVTNFEAHAKKVNFLTFNKDGSLLVSGSDDGNCIEWPMVVTTESIGALHAGINRLFLEEEKQIVCKHDVAIRSLNEMVLTPELASGEIGQKYFDQLDFLFNQYVSIKNKSELEAKIKVVNPRYNIDCLLKSSFQEKDRLQAICAKFVGINPNFIVITEEMNKKRDELKKNINKLFTLTQVNVDHLFKEIEKLFPRDVDQERANELKQMLGGRVYYLSNWSFFNFLNPFAWNWGGWIYRVANFVNPFSWFTSIKSGISKSAQKDYLRWLYQKTVGGRR